MRIGFLKLWVLLFIFHNILELGIFSNTQLVLKFALSIMDENNKKQ